MEHRAVCLWIGWDIEISPVSCRNSRLTCFPDDSARQKTPGKKNEREWRSLECYCAPFRLVKAAIGIFFSLFCFISFEERSKWSFVWHRVFCLCVSWFVWLFFFLARCTPSCVQTGIMILQCNKYVLALPTEKRHIWRTPSFHQNKLFGNSIFQHTNKLFHVMYSSECTGRLRKKKPGTCCSLPVKLAQRRCYRSPSVSQRGSTLR